MLNDEVEEGMKVLEMVLGIEEPAKESAERVAQIIDYVSDEVLENWLLRSAMHFQVTEAEYEKFVDKVLERLEDMGENGEIPEEDVEKIAKELRSEKGQLN